MTGREGLEHRVLEALGWPCEVCAAAIRVVLAQPHDRHAFDIAVVALGFSNRQALARLIQKHGLPAPRQLQHWLRVLVMLDVWERHGQHLQGQAYANGVEPTVLHRVVVRVTDSSWQTVRNAGLDTALIRFAESVGTKVTCRRI